MAWVNDYQHSDGIRHAADRISHESGAAFVGHQQWQN